VTGKVTSSYERFGLSVLQFYPEQFKSRRFLFWLSVNTMLGFIAVQDHLYNCIQVDLAFVLSLVAGAAALHLGINMEKTAPAYHRQPAALFILTWAATCSAMLPGLLLVVTLGADCSSCSTLGWVWMLLGPFSTTLFAGALAVSATLILGHRRAAFFVTAIFFFDLAIAVFRIATSPPLVQIGHLYGFFPGSFYDMAQPFRNQLLLLRISDLFWIVVFYLACTTVNVRKALSTKVIFSFFVLAMISFEIFDPLSINPDRQDILRALPLSVETEHFTIHMARGTKKQAQYAMAMDHEYNYARLVKLLGFAPRSKFDSYIYPSRTLRRKLLGAARTSIARPWSGEMHLVWSGFPHPVLAHELSHLFSRYMGNFVTGLPGRPWSLPHMALIEGFAVASAWDEHEYSPHALSAALFALNMEIPIDKLFETGAFWKAVPSRAYLESGSFIAFLWEKQGRKKFMDAYRLGDLQAAYHLSLRNLGKRWRRFLQKQVMKGKKPGRDLLSAAMYRFKMPSLFNQACARDIALQKKRGYEFMIGKDPVRAIASFSRASRCAHGRPDLLIGLSRAYLAEGRTVAARRCARLCMLFPGISPRLKAIALESTGDSYLFDKNNAMAVRFWKQALKMHSGAGSKRRLFLKTSLAGKGDPLAGYLVPGMSDFSLLQKAAKTGSPGKEAMYLQGIRKADALEAGQAVRLLEGAGDMSEIGAAVEFNRLLKLADSLLLLNEPGRAYHVYDKLFQAGTRDGEKAMLSDRMSRCLFVEKKNKEKNKEKVDPFTGLIHPFSLAAIQ